MSSGKSSAVKATGHSAHSIWSSTSPAVKKYIARRRPQSPRNTTTRKDMLPYLELIEQSPVYTAMLAFFGLYPMLTSLVWMISALVYFVRRDRQPQSQDSSYLPFVSVVIPA